MTTLIRLLAFFFVFLFVYMDVLDSTATAKYLNKKKNRNVGSIMNKYLLFLYMTTRLINLNCVNDIGFWLLWTLISCQYWHLSAWIYIYKNLFIRCSFVRCFYHFFCIPSNLQWNIENDLWIELSYMNRNDKSIKTKYSLNYQ